MKKQTDVVEKLSDTYGTPQALFDNLDAEFAFGLDACASDWNHKCPDHYTIKEDGLSMPWVRGTGAVWVNPPYSVPNIPKWLEKAHSESVRRRRVVVMLLPADTSTKWFHKYRRIASQTRFLFGRTRFIDPETRKPAKDPPRFGSLVFVFEPEHVDSCWSSK